MKPQKHCEVIKAWADGAQIQFKLPKYSHWNDIAGNPEWLDNLDYRVKPPKREMWVRPFEYTGVVSVSTSPRNDFDTAFSPRMWVGPAVKVWEESE